MAYLELDKTTGATVLNPGKRPRTRTANPCAKTRDKDNPYEVWQAGAWEWRVLKKYQVDDSKPYARWLCAVRSPFTYGGFDVGDCYVQDITRNARKV
jgi:hypothetical protein